MAKRITAIVMDAFGARQFQSSNKAVSSVIDFDVHEFTRRVNEVCVLLTANRCDRPAGVTIPIISTGTQWFTRTPQLVIRC
jgi:hypothetical protein